MDIIELITIIGLCILGAIISTWLILSSAMKTILVIMVVLIFSLVLQSCGRKHLYTPTGKTFLIETTAKLYVADSITYRGNRCVLYLDIYGYQNSVCSNDSIWVVEIK